MNAAGADVPATWNGAAGVVVPTPMLPPLWKITELPRFTVSVNTPMQPAEPALCGSGPAPLASGRHFSACGLRYVEPSAAVSVVFACKHERRQRLAAQRLGVRRLQRIRHAHQQDARPRGLASTRTPSQLRLTADEHPAGSAVAVPSTIAV